MRRSMGTPLIAGTALIVLLCLMECISFAWEAPAGRGDDAGSISTFWESEERGTISVTGAARENVAPDIVILTLAVETTGMTANEAVVQNGRMTESMIAAVRALLGPDEEESIRTSSYAVRPVYEFDREEKKNTLTGYRVTHQVRIRTGKTELAGRIIDVAVQNGANRAEDVSFALEEDEERCQRVLAIALESASRQAAFVARSLGAEVGSVKSVVPSCRQDAPAPVLRHTLAEAGQPSSPETVIESGEVVVRASAEIVFFLDQD